MLAPEGLPVPNMDGYHESTHFVPMRDEWRFILDRRRNEALSAFRFDVASFLRVPLNDVSDLLVRPDIRMIECKVKHTSLLTPGDIAAILRNCEFPEMSLLVHECFFPDGFTDGVFSPGSQLPQPKDPEMMDRAYRMYFPGKHWGKLLENFRVDAEMAAKADVLEVLHATEILEEMPEMVTSFKPEARGTWLVYSVEDDRLERRIPRRDFFSRNTFPQLWALYAEHADQDPGWMDRNTLADTESGNRFALPAIISEEPDGVVDLPGEAWPELLKYRIKELKLAGKSDVINVLEEHKETFYGAPKVKVRFEPTTEGARILCKVLNPKGLSAHHFESRNRILNAYHFPLTMKEYDKYFHTYPRLPPATTESQMSPPRPAGSDLKQRVRPLQMPLGRKSADANNLGSPKSFTSFPGTPSRRPTSKLGGNRYSVTPESKIRPYTYRCKFKGHHWREVLGMHPYEIHKAAIKDVLDVLMAKQGITVPPKLDVQIVVAEGKPGAFAYFKFYDRNLATPTQEGHEMIQKCKFTSLFDIYFDTVEGEHWEETSSFGRGDSRIMREEREQSISMFSPGFSARGEDNLWTPAATSTSFRRQSEKQSTMTPVASSPRRSVVAVNSDMRHSQTGGQVPDGNTFIISMNGDPLSQLPYSSAVKGCEVRVPFPDVRWKESVALERAAEVDRYVRQDIAAIFMRSGAIQAHATPPCAISTFVPAGANGGMLYMKFSQKDKQTMERAKPLLMDHKNYHMLMSLYK